MGVSPALLALHVMLVLLTGTATSDHKQANGRRPQHARQSLTPTPESEGCHNSEQRTWQVLTGERESHEEPPVSCGDGFCRCDGRHADCSRNFGKLAYIPVLPTDIEFLNFSFNRLESIGNRDFFLNASNVSGIDLSANALSQVHMDAFQFLWNLTTLFLRCNPELNYANLVPLFSVITLQPLHHSDFISRKFLMPGLTALDLSQNRIRAFDVSMFAPLGKLRQLGVRGDVSASVRVHIEELYLDVNSVSVFPETCENRESLFPWLSHLSLPSNLIRFLPRRVCLPSLEVLDLSMNKIQVFRSNRFRVQLFPSLKTLLADRMRVRLVQIERHAFRHPAVSVISLEYNGINFSSETVDADAFSGCLGLKSLRLSGNDFSGINESKFRKLFSHMPSLRELALRGNSLTISILDSFDGFQNLERLDVSDNRLTAIGDGALDSLRHLNLSNNKLTDIAYGVFDNLPHLDNLDLSFNQIQRVSESTFDPGTRQRLQSLDISGNPLQSSPRLSWFCHWLKDDPDLFNISRSSYRCANKPNANVTSVGSGGPVSALFVHVLCGVSINMVASAGVLVILHELLFVVSFSVG
ncbi:hypothetical protein BaRGS_00005264 [Batillaria attramentaria]|uniref:Uncharacterized protein n=1 Tax=Batillaria attramentaria TaxID=370345 RepID=A0ABD0LW56_9CAEN